MLSLISYTTKVAYMLIPTEETELMTRLGPQAIPGYGSRGWCRAEYFIFSCWAEMMGQQPQLYAILRDGRLERYREVKVWGEEDMPTGGDLSNPADREAIKKLEDDMIDAYGHGVIAKEFKGAKEGGKVNLSSKMLRDAHVPTLFAAVDKSRVGTLELGRNQLGDEGAIAIAEHLKTDKHLKELHLQDNK